MLLLSTIFTVNLPCPCYSWIRRPPFHPIKNTSTVRFVAYIKSNNFINNLLVLDIHWAWLRVTFPPSTVCETAHLPSLQATSVFLSVNCLHCNGSQNIFCHFSYITAKTMSIQLYTLSVLNICLQVQDESKRTIITIHADGRKTKILV